MRWCPASKPRPAVIGGREPNARDCQLRACLYSCSCAFPKLFPPLPRTVEMQRAGIGLYNKLRSGVFLSNVAARGLKNHWTRRNVKIAFIKRTALLHYYATTGFNNNNSQQRAMNTHRVQRTEVFGLPRLCFRNLSR